MAGLFCFRNSRIAEPRANASNSGRRQHHHASALKRCAHAIDHLGIDLNIAPSCGGANQFKPAHR